MYRKKLIFIYIFLLMLSIGAMFYLGRLMQPNNNEPRDWDVIQKEGLLRIVIDTLYSKDTILSNHNNKAFLAGKQGPKNGGRNCFRSSSLKIFSRNRHSSLLITDEKMP